MHVKLKLEMHSFDRGVSIVDIPGVPNFRGIFKLNTQSVLNPLHEKITL